MAKPGADAQWRRDDAVEAIRLVRAGDRPGVAHDLLGILQRRIVDPPTQLPAQVLGGLMFAAAGLALRFMLTPLMREMAPFVAVYPAVLAAAVFFGVRGAAACIAACLGVSAWIVLNDPAWRPGSGLVPLFLFLGSAGAMIGLVALLRDALREAVAARDRQALLVAELQHRVKNTLAIVQALSRQTWRSTPEPAAFHGQFSDRLIALAEAHTLLSEVAWGGVSLDAVARRALAPFEEQPSRIRRHGEAVQLSPEQALGLALCLHELATNAMKHGALSTPAGSIDLSWSLEDADAMVDVRWIERDGPAVSPPARSGFGSQILRGQVTPTAETPRLEFDPKGLRWSLRLRRMPTTAAALSPAG